MPAAKAPSDETLEAMTLAYLGGQSFRAAGAPFGLAKNTARKYLLESGVAPDRGRSISRAAIGRPSHRRGAKHCAETRAKLSAIRRGFRATRTGPHTPETRAKISAAVRAAIAEGRTRWKPSSCS